MKRIVADKLVSQLDVKQNLDSFLSGDAGAILTKRKKTQIDS
jgi:hypothetical protein